MTNLETLVARARGLIDDARAAAPSGSGRAVLGIVGAPGSGKSTLATALGEALGLDQAVVVPMDGYHLAHAELERLGRVERKGAPDTYDAAGFVSLMRRIVGQEEDVVYAPEFRRSIEDAVAGAIPVPREVPLVIVEGNYLLLDQQPWSEARELLNESWYVDVDDELRLERLVARHMAFGRDLEAAKAHAMGSDQRNAEVIAESAERADLRVEVPATVGS